MKERGMTKKELISKSGISSEEYDLMNSNQDVSLATLRNICRLFNCDYNKIINIVSYNSQYFKLKH